MTDDSDSLFPGVIPWEVFFADQPEPPKNPAPPVRMNQWFDIASKKAIEYLTEVNHDERLIGAYKNDVEFEHNGTLYVFNYVRQGIFPDERDAKELQISIINFGPYEEHQSMTWLILPLAKLHFQKKVGASCGRNKATGRCVTSLSFEGTPKNVCGNLSLLRIAMQFGKKAIRL